MTRPRLPRRRTGPEQPPGDGGGEEDERGRAAGGGIANIGFWLRWSWRDLRERAVLVIAIAATIGVGTGAYAGLTSTSVWRTSAEDASYAALRMYDLRALVTGGLGVPEGDLVAATRAMPHPEWIKVAQERLVMPTQVEAVVADGRTVVPGVLIGLDVRSREPLLNDVAVRAGRGLTAEDSRRDVAIIDYHFAREKKLPPSGTLRLPGDHELVYVGTGLTPEYFLVTTEEGGIRADANFAALIAPLETVQRVTDRPGIVNDLVVRLAPGVDTEAAQDELLDTLETRLPGHAITVRTVADDPAHRILYDNIDTDQRLYSVFALVILAGATFAAFNLTTRIVESQRRQIGISMALGVTPRWIALRPLLVGAQVALLGVFLGIGMGLLIDVGLDSLLSYYFPLPIWSADFQPAIFLQAALLGFAIPFAASIYPVWRAVSVAPIDAIRTGFTTARGSGLAGLARHLPLPGDTFDKMPLRNLLRTPRRSFLTALGVGAAVTVFVGTTGLIDTFAATIDVGEAELTHGAPARVSVLFDGFVPTAYGESQVRGARVTQAIDSTPRVPITMESGTTSIDAALILSDPETAIWTPRMTVGTVPAASNRSEPLQIAISEVAAEQLGVTVGDTVAVTYPRRSGTETEDVDGEAIITGIHAIPLRTLAYGNLGSASVFGIRGYTNSVTVVPAAGETVASVKDALFGKAGVVSVQPVGTTAEIFRDLVNQYLSMLAIVQATALALAALIAFNSATIALDERSREHATMFAFGTRLRTALGMAMVESALLGLLGTAFGVLAGRAVIEYIVREVMTDVVPDIGFTIALGAGTIAQALVLGTLVVGLAPLLGARRLAVMDVPSALRVVE